MRFFIPATYAKVSTGQPDECSTHLDRILYFKHCVPPRWLSWAQKPWRSVNPTNLLGRTADPETREAGAALNSESTAKFILLQNKHANQIPTKLPHNGVKRVSQSQNCISTLFYRRTKKLFLFFSQQQKCLSLDGSSTLLCIVINGANLRIS